MMTNNAMLIEQAKIELCLFATPSTSTPKYVSLKNYLRATIIISVLNATTVTGSAITLKQATDIANANSDEKAVAFTTAYRDVDVAAGEGLSVFTVSNNTFTTAAVNSKQMQYIIEVTPDMLDIDNGFDCLRVGTGDATAATVVVEVILWPAKYGRGAASALAAEVN